MLSRKGASQQPAASQSPAEACTARFWLSLSRRALFGSIETKKRRIHAFAPFRATAHHRMNGFGFTQATETLAFNISATVRQCKLAFPCLQANQSVITVSKPQML